ncbi:MAG TPA: SlyX family protein [Rhodanobacteraceae bacterium]|nr:SlyX family protein [Rhodanobacteraceae bacterium]
MATPTLEERLTELEVRFAFLEDAVATLNGTVAEHDRLLLHMRTEFERMRLELGTVRVALADDVRNEPPPPHY